MTILYDYNNLWKAKGYGKDGHTLENTIRWMTKTATQAGIDTEIAQMAISEIIQEVMGGREFPLDKCPCGCGIDKSGTAINHAMRERMYDIATKVHFTISKMLEDRHNSSIMKHIEQENARYIDENLPVKNGKGVVRDAAVKTAIVAGEIVAVFGAVSLLGYLVG